MVEPSGRNTAPCIAWGAHEVEGRSSGEGVVVVLPADHRIGQPEAFRDSLEAAIHLAQETGDIVTLGVRPSRPETGYGYLELGEAVQVQEVEARTVSRFCEKPDERRAMQWFKLKRIFGMRVFSSFGLMHLCASWRLICRRLIRR